MTEARSYFLPYQERWIDDDSTFKIAEKSRRVGFTYASSYRMFKKCMTRGADFKQFVSSRTLDLAQEFIRDYIQKWCKLGNVVAEGMYGDNVVVVDPEKNITAFQCVFPTGARIISLSSKPEAFAGRGGDVFLDEADLHEHSDDLIDMATPCIMWGNKLEIVSAYRVDGTKDTPFAKLVADAKKDNPQHASLHRVTIHDAVAQGLVEKINEATGRNRSREEFLKEMRALVRTQAAWESQFECKVQDAGGKLLKTANYAACELPPEEIAAIEAAHPNAPRFAGYDVARHVHASAYHEYIKLGVTLYLVYRETFHDMPFDAQEKFLRGKMRRREKPIARLAMDSTGLGMQMAETMAKEFPGRVDQVNLESHRRHELCMLLRDHVDNKRTYFPADDSLREDMSAPTLYTVTTGAMRVRVPQFENADGEVSHADEFMAAVLGHGAAEGGETWTFAPEAVDRSLAASAPADGGRIGMRDDFTSRRLD